VGKKLTVRFQELTEESSSNSAAASHTTGGIPRFPVGIAFRDYEWNI
jgi:hypothetical protein